jgi:hypothetical protein
MNALLKKYPPISTIDIEMEPGDHPPLVKHSPNTPLRRSSGLFLKGPIPFDWLKKANALGGSTGIIATGLWFYVGLNNSKSFKVDSKLDQLTGVARQTRQHALRKLQQAGLVELSQPHGAYPLVTVITNPT